MARLTKRRMRAHAQQRIPLTILPSAQGLDLAEVSDLLQPNDIVRFLGRQTRRGTATNLAHLLRRKV